MNKLFSRFVFLILPLFFIFSQILASKAAGPKWMAVHSDPEYLYLLNSLNLAEYKAIGHWDHPGTPVQIVGFLVLTADRSISHQGSHELLRKSVLLNPEKYVSMITMAIIILYALTLFLTGRMVFFATKSLTAALLFQSLPYLFSVFVFAHLHRLSSEPMVFLWATWLASLVTVYVLKPNYFSQNKFALLTGIVIGAGLASKLTLISATIIPLFIFRGFSQFRIYILSSVISFLICTRPIWNRLSLFFQWIKNLTIHTGRYGGGDSGIIDIHQALNFVGIVLEAIPIFPLAFFSGIVFLSISNNHSQIMKRGLWGIMCAMLLHLIITAKHPALHYMISISPLAAALCLILWLSKNDIKNKKARLFLKMVLITCFVWEFFKSGQQLIQMDTRYGGFYEEVQSINALIQKDYSHCAIITYAPYSLQHSFLLANGFAIYRFNESLQEIYPQYYLYDRSEKKFRSWTGLTSLTELTKKYSCVLLKGMPAEKIEDGHPLTLQGTPLFKGKFQVLQKL